MSAENTASVTFRVNAGARLLELWCNDEIVDTWTFDEAFDKAIWLIRVTGEFADELRQRG